LADIWSDAPLYGGILVGGGSSRMGQAKHLMQHAGRTWLDHAVDALRGRVSETVILGKAEMPQACESFPCLADVPGAGGPIAGMLAAMRWAPMASWLFVACDMPLISGEAVDWLLSFRAPGVWAVLPRLDGSPRVEPLLAYYNFRSLPCLEQVSVPRGLAGHDNVRSPLVPASLAAAWSNINTPSDCENVLGR